MEIDEIFASVKAAAELGYRSVVLQSGESHQYPTDKICGMLSRIKKELGVIREKYGNERRTQIVPDEGEINIEDLIANEGCIITITHAGFIKRTAVSAYRAQRRGVRRAWTRRKPSGCEASDAARRSQGG